MVLALQQNPLLQDVCATVVAAAGAIALVKIFRALSSRGIVDQVQEDTLTALHHRHMSCPGGLVDQFRQGLR